MVHLGFDRLGHHFARVADSDDPVSDMALIGRAYRHNAQANPHLYSVMLGASSLPVFSLSEADRQYGRYTLVSVVACARRCIAAGRFAWSDPELVAHHMWITVHGLCSLELGGYLVDPYDADRCFEAQLTALMVSAGDTPEAAEASVTASLGREKVIDVALAAKAVAAPQNPLDRELDVLGMAASGAGLAEIAAELHLSKGTVRNYLGAIVTKLGARNRLDAVRIATEARVLNQARMCGIDASADGPWSRSPTSVSGADTPCARRSAAHWRELAMATSLSPLAA
ncbi:hypothetical protein E1293_12785 [Actinomadura darangshiensis]|uniref:HTH luxR-type domain-containing protein n=2 Tax=Actinomadura darangshiensis TaxID=705336 RepID=A0A4R5BHN0_9ACTN|nr:hypothetical protein E1293_12785 [Actinomadura darangshiensis]